MSAEIVRVERVFTGMLEAYPLDFSNAPTLKASPHTTSLTGSVRGVANSRKKREYISLMREFADVRTMPTDDT